MSIPKARPSAAGVPARRGSLCRRLSCAAALSLGVAACSGGAGVTEAMRGTLPCHPVDRQAAAPARCDRGPNVLMAMAAGRAIPPRELVEEQVLEEQRGGFITAGGLQVNFGFEFRTIVDGLPQLTSVLTYQDVLSGQAGTPHINSVSLAGEGGGITSIVHGAGPNGINTTILNSQDGVQIEHVSTLAIDIINLGRVHRGGRALGNGRRMPLEMQRAIIHSLKQ